MLKPLALLLVLFLFIFNAGAQQKILSGYIKDSLTQLPITNCLVTNKVTQVKVRTDNKGFFILLASPGDFIFLSSPNYKYHSFSYSYLSADTVTIYLPPDAKVLENITVKSGYEKYKMDSLERRGRFEEAMGTANNKLIQDRTSGFGLIINLDRFFKSKYRNRKKQEAMFDNLEKQAYIDFRFPAQMVAFYSGLKGEELRNFMYRYSPTYEWLRQHPTKEEVIDFINSQLKIYRQRLHTTDTSGKNKR